MSSERRYAFLRAINTGGRRLTNDELLVPFFELGFADAAAYQAAGNVTFTAATTDPAELEEAIEHALRAAFEFDSPAFVRTGADLRSIIDAAPFTDAELSATAGKVQVAFLRSGPDDHAKLAVAGLTPPNERSGFVGAHWFWLPQDGISTSSLPVGKVEAALGPMTIRTLGTLQRMYDKFGD